MSLKKERNSNLELLRIFSILAIIGDHFTGQSGITAGGGLTAFYCAVTSLSRVACSVFIIISSWFLVDMPFRFKRIVRTWLTVIMFTVPITLYCMYLGLATKNNLYTAFLPIEGSPLWFAGYYIVLVLLSPALNLLMSGAYKKVHEWILFALFCLTVLYPTITANLNFLSNELWCLIFLYLTTGYIKKYKTIPGYKISFFVFGIVWCLLTFMRAYTAKYASSNVYILTLIRAYGEFYRAQLPTLPNLILAYSAFFGFYGLKVKPSKLINTVSSASLGVYCFHQVPTWYKYLWTNLFKSSIYAEMLQGYRRALYIMCSIFLVWIIGTVLELVRRRVSHFFVEDRQYCSALCKRIDSLIDPAEEADQTDRQTETSLLEDNHSACSLFCWCEIHVNRTLLVYPTQYRAKSGGRKS